MALRELVTGGASCAAPSHSSSSANPLGNFVDSLLGSQSKTQERLRELPGLAASSHIGHDIGTSGPLTYLPGSELEQENDQQSGQVSEFMRGFHGIDHSGFADAWNDVTRVPGPPPIIQESRGDPSNFSEFEQIYTGGREAAMQPMPGYGTPQRVLSGFLSSFVGSAQDGVPFHPVNLPELGLSAADKCQIRDRCTIMAHHFFAEKGDEYVNDQVNALLHSLDIESDLRVWGPHSDRSAELDKYWNQSPAQSNFASRGGAETSDNWVPEFAQRPSFKEGAENWVNEFRHSDLGGWVDQVGKEQAQSAARSVVQNGDLNNMAALDHTRSLVETLSQNTDPKFQNSKFLQFVSKMSRGELIIEDTKVKPCEGFDSQASGDVWASEFTAGEHIHHADDWVEEFRHNKNLETSTSEGWINELSNLNMNSWADEYDEQLANGTVADDSTSSWVDSYEKYVEEKLKGEQKWPPSSRWLYQFADQNPYVGHPNPLKEGQNLFQQGLLSEAVLALEAEVLKNPDNAEGWRLLGITHAENDDDRQAIASMVRARDADPANLEVLLSLGVSHTNELEQREALTYLQGWLQHHPKYGMLIQQTQQESLSHSEVTKCFLEAAQICPGDPDVHTVLGVLYNLSREYDSAIEAFQTSLKLKPKDYSLWNKLGATQANSARSANAIHAYQEALDLKPNYVRAWSNMGISYANQGLYKESLSYYVRALCMNPKADNAWQYLRISLSILGRSDMLDACNRQDLDLLQKEFPL